MSDEQFPWNKESEERAFWDSNVHQQVMIQAGSLKQRLENPGGYKFEDLLRDLCTGTAQVMTQLEAVTKQLNALEKALGFGDTTPRKPRRY